MSLLVRLGVLFVVLLFSWQAGAGTVPNPPSLFSINGTLVTSGALPGTNVLSEDFEGGTIGALGQQTYFDHALAVVDKNTGDAPVSSISGTKILRFELRPTDKNVNGSYRAEVHSTFSNTMQAHLRNWAEWYIYFPANFNPGSIYGTGLILGQIHGNGGYDTAPVSTLTLQHDNGTYYWNVMGTKLVSGTVVKSNITVGGTRAQVFNEHGQWVKLRYEYKASLSGDGATRVWKDDVLIAEMTGNVGKSITDDPYFKTGIYHRGTNTIIIFVDDINISTE